MMFNALFRSRTSHALTSSVFKMPLQPCFRPVAAPTTMMFRAFSTSAHTKPANHNENDDLTNVPRISLDDFYASLTDFTITDEEALEYMNFAAKQAMVTFKDQEEMLSFKGDFQAALAFIQKLDEVDIKGEEPLGNVLEFYGGNDSKMRSEKDF